MDWLLILQNAGLPATEAHILENLKIGATFSRELTPAEWLLFLQLTDPARHELEISRADLKEQADAAITRLQEYQTATPPFTQAGYTALINAVKDMAVIEEKLLKVLRRII